MERVFVKLRSEHPELVVRKRHVLPPPIIGPLGTKRTMWSNLSSTAKLLQRNDEHLRSFVQSELGVDTTVDGKKRLLINGKFRQKQVESILRKYICAYVECLNCHQPDTILLRDSMTRLYVIQCSLCKSTRSVSSISQGFHATTRADRRATKQ